MFFYILIIYCQTINLSKRVTCFFLSISDNFQPIIIILVKYVVVAWSPVHLCSPLMMYKIKALVNEWPEQEKFFLGKKPWGCQVRWPGASTGVALRAWRRRIDEVGLAGVRKWTSWVGREADIDSMARWQRDRRKWDEMLKRRVRAVAWRHPSTDLRENIAKVDGIKRGCVHVVHNGGYECSLDEEDGYRWRFEVRV